MKIYGNLKDCLVMTKKSHPGIKDPSRTYNYLGVVCNGELGELSCTEEVYKATEIWNNYDFGFCYNTERDFFQLEVAQHMGFAQIPPAALAALQLAFSSAAPAESEPEKTPESEPEKASEPAEEKKKGGK